jgi:PTH1 family peptidyl-tRNA hydrolase
MSWGDIILLAGLGNPGSQYSRTRHNAGFICIDAIAREFKFSPEKEKYEALIADTNFENRKIILAKPLTYMNNSGTSIQKITNFYKISTENVIVIHDDIDLELGDIRVKRGGGHAGHNGLRSLDSLIGKDYLRIRIGVGRPEKDKHEVSDFVLSKFSKEEQIVIDEINYGIAKNLKLIFEDKIDEFIAKVKN